MAMLKNLANDVDVVLTLRAIEGTSEWLGYDLKVLEGKDSKREIMRLYYVDGLFFDNFIENEVVSFCHGLQMVISGQQEAYTFEPYDEKDFRFEIKHNDNFYRINLFMLGVQLLETYLWNGRSLLGVELYVSKEALVIFSDELKAEYGAVLKK